MLRREFVGRSLALCGAAALREPTPAGAAPAPWYRRVLRWGQTNVREIDVASYDVAWWRQHWKRTATQGVIVNAGGIVAYYPSRFPLHYRAAGLGDRDLFGELARAAHDDGLAVLARMDSNRAHEDFYRAHPDWFAVDADGKPYRDTDLYVACVNSPYYDEYIPSVLREIVERSHPEGFADNNWNGLRRDSICHCANCERKFGTLPRARDWNDPTYRRWIAWSYARRLEIWDLFNHTTRDVGGPDCLWIGMNSGSISGQSSAFRDFKAICERSELVLLDHQFRTNASGFQSNGDAGKLVHGLLGWDRVVPESMAMYQAGPSQFRLAAKPPNEARMWMLDGIAGGIQPWWHHVGAAHEDRRMFRTAEPVTRWHAAHERYLVGRTPVATVGIVWSQTNGDFYGRDAVDDLVELPRRGWTNALVRARIPYLPVHADHLARDGHRFSALILPDVGAMTTAQVDAVRGFVAAGGAVIATGESSRFDEWGDARPDYALADLFGAHAAAESIVRRQAGRTEHTYLRLLPASRAWGYGPGAPRTPSTGARHAALAGFDETDILAFGGVLQPLRVEPSARVLATWIPPSPTFPPEEAWMREPRTDVPALLVNGRVAFLPADLDRRYARDNLPDHGDLLANLVRWAAADTIPLHVDGAGFVDCHLYRQPGRLVLHVVNLTSAGTWRAPVDELIRVGPLRVRVRAGDVRASRVRLLVANVDVAAVSRDGWVEFELPSVLDHEVAVVGRTD
ncbi:Glycoside hydrolase family 42 domain protein [Gemmatirosa kalamazoonensis]|uniref:Glycoside hydrolase family 42 domain protein n=1 Tax=Gemmatirosa kalamazoonensis TaxID=861299 RepID=W0RLC1_9BACT|nr:alpha-amylase family protein [Gemmatirosa kalamazoonensis]AHG91576.1 Glycoside hydrolase family 42 domain protein [Gemmatirosa kalamazoonensis]